MSVDKYRFEDKNSKEYLDCKEKSIKNGFIVFEKVKGHAFRPIIPLCQQCTKEEYDYKKELEYGILFLRNQNYVSKKFYQN